MSSDSVVRLLRAWLSERRDDVRIGLTADLRMMETWHARGAHAELECILGRLDEVLGGGDAELVFELRGKEAEDG